jgi:hypothetical protein
LREYRRDVGRFCAARLATIRKRRGIISAVPRCFWPTICARATGERHGDLVGDFPVRPLAATIENTWYAGAVGVYRNWIKYLKDQKTNHRPSTAFERAQRVSA